MHNTDFIPKFILIWIPGHCKISGNEFADQTAKLATKSPLISTININERDLTTHIRIIHKENHLPLWFQTSHWYQNINKTKSNIKHFLKFHDEDINRIDQIKFERLRLGHTNLTHSFILEKLNPPSICQYCNIPIRISIPHLLTECKYFDSYRKTIFDSTDPLSCLSDPTTQNIKKILFFLKTSNIFKLI